MEYKSIRQTLYQGTSSLKPSEEAEQLYTERINGPATFTTGIILDGKHEAFVVLFRELSTLIERILQTEISIEKLWNDLPPIARNAYLYDLLTEELLSTNQMEGVRSTRQEINEALQAAETPHTSKRFSEFAKLYIALLGDENFTRSLPKTLEDIRKIYDQVTDGELAEDALPDGDLFRKGQVHIQDVSNNKNIHSGVTPEASIKVLLTQMLTLMGNEEIPALLRTVISHFVFEYVHPFYDGNGRTGRYLLALQLRENLSTPTALSLSPAISENKNKYYKAFSDAENQYNCSELSFFSFTMLQLLSESQLGLREDLAEKSRTLASSVKALKTFEAKNSPTETWLNTLAILVQEELFGKGASKLTRKVFADTLDIGYSKVTSTLNALGKEGLVEQRGKKPIYFALTEHAKELFIPDFARD